MNKTNPYPATVCIIVVERVHYRCERDSTLEYQRAREGDRGCTGIGSDAYFRGLDQRGASPEHPRGADRPAEVPIEDGHGDGSDHRAGGDKRYGTRRYDALVAVNAGYSFSNNAWNIFHGDPSEFFVSGWKDP